ncbi:MAG TPA: SRPBCC domain-containing protein [Acidimicrobiales bacterium]|nr:SRPBCC domain-containing protein [Acidimicrobiales bacterium]
MTHPTTERGVVRLERTIPAPPHRVYRAWLEPHLVARWMAPGGLAVTRVAVDERVGGHYRVWQSVDGADAGGFEAELLELVPDRRLVFRWGFVGPERTDGPTYDSRLTVSLAEAPGGATALTLVHERLEDLATALPHVAEQVGTGWDLALEKLAAELEA